MPTWDKVSAIQSSGYQGEKLAAGFLAGSFIVHDQSTDRDGSDLMLFPRVENEKLRAMEEEITPWAIVQAKFFKCGGAAYIKTKYAVDQLGPRPHFFVNIIAEDKEGELIRYFLTADEILSLPESKSGERRFSLTDGIDRSNLKRKVREVHALVEQGMSVLKTRLEAIVVKKAMMVSDNFETSKRFFRMRAASKSRNSDTEYHLINLELCSDYKERTLAHKWAKTIMAVVPGESEARAIDARWDLVESPGTWSWGYGGKGPHIAAASILAHFFGGSNEEPTAREIDSVLFGIVADLDEGENHLVLGARINRVLNPPLANLQPASHSNLASGSEVRKQ